MIYTALNYCVDRYVNDLEFFRFSLHNAHRIFFMFTERFCIDNTRVTDGKIRYSVFRNVNRIFPFPALSSLPVGNHQQCFEKSQC
jgi:hypothetical protein